MKLISIKTSRDNRNEWTVTVATITVGVMISILILFNAYQGEENRAEFKTDLTPEQVATIEITQLLTLRQTDAVCREILRRETVQLEVLQNALQFLAMRQRTSDLQVLLTLTEQLDDDSREAELRNFVKLYAGISASQGVWRDRIVALSSHPSTSARRVAFAVKIFIDDGADKVLSTGSTAERTIEVLNALPFVASEPLQERLYDDVQRLALSSDADSDVQIVAIKVATQLHGRHAEKTRDLLGLIQDRRHVVASLAAINSTPTDLWPADQLGAMAAAIISWMAEMPPAERRSVNTADARELTEKLTRRLSESKRRRFTERISQLLAE